MTEELAIPVMQYHLARPLVDEGVSRLGPLRRGPQAKTTLEMLSRKVRLALCVCIPSDSFGQKSKRQNPNLETLAGKRTPTERLPTPSQSPSRSAIFLSELWALFPLIALALETPTSLDSHSQAFWSEKVTSTPERDPLKSIAMQLPCVS